MSNDYIAPYPHCNTEVLHEPGACKFCDLYPNRQQGRIVSNTPFSPVEQAWPGNSPDGYPPLDISTWDWHVEVSDQHHLGGWLNWRWELYSKSGEMVSSGWAMTETGARIAGWMRKVWWAHDGR